MARPPCWAEGHDDVRHTGGCEPARHCRRETRAPKQQRELSAEEFTIVEGLVCQARDSGVTLTGPEDFSRH